VEEVVCSAADWLWRRSSALRQTGCRGGRLLLQQTGCGGGRLLPRQTGDVSSAGGRRPTSAGLVVERLWRRSSALQQTGCGGGRLPYGGLVVIEVVCSVADRLW
jgi:hypothetical protein